MFPILHRSHLLSLQRFFIDFALIVWMYRWETKQERSSTNRVLDAIHAEKEIPIKTAPLIFASTVLTHLFGGSAGREGEKDSAIFYETNALFYVKPRKREC
mgnify:CR=1 FL=1